MFAKIPKVIGVKFRAILRQMFAARLKREQPAMVELFLDTMVLDNDDANQRQGCQATYKKVKGFQPLQLSWRGQIVDAQFRGGSKHGNHGETALHMIEKAVKIIRKQLGYELAILVRMDAGFFDGDLYRGLDVWNVGFVATGRLSEAVKAMAAAQTQWQTFSNGDQTWDYCEWGTRCKEWESFYRAIYLKPRFEDRQMLLEFARPEQIILTNMGSCGHLYRRVPEKTRQAMYETWALIAQHHRKGADDLVHRALKDFGSQQLPFKSFGANTAIYYLMVIAFNVMECYKHQVLAGIVGVGSYATTVRRVAIDFAAKFVRTGRKLIMKVTQATMDRLGLEAIWASCNQSFPLLA